MATAPAAARNHRSRLVTIAATAIAAARRAWQKIDATGNWQEQYQSSIGPQLAVLAAAAQLASARESDAYAAEVLNELAFGPPTAPGVLNPSAFAGLTGDGRAVTGLLAQSVVRAGEAYNDLSRAADLLPDGAPTQLERANMALGSSQDYMDLIFNEIMADTARAAESAALTERQWVTGYIRMLNPSGGKGSLPCSRCIVLAGKFFLWNEGFLRHPLCRCIHIPAAEEAPDVHTRPDRYFDSLSTGDQNKIFTKAGAQAIRDGADISQIVNARRGMQIASHRGTGTRVITSEGTTRRAWYGGGYAARKYGYEDWFKRSGYTSTDVGQRGAVKNYRENRTNAVRLMPEQIYAIANSREEAIALLKKFGYLI